MDIQHVLGFFWLVFALSSIWTGRVVWDRYGDVTMEKSPIIYALCAGLQFMAASVFLFGHPDASSETIMIILGGTPVVAALTLAVRKVRGLSKLGGRLAMNLWALGALLVGTSVVLGLCFGLHS